MAIISVTLASPAFFTGGFGSGTLVKRAGKILRNSPI
jgi:hypothetical protein